MVTMKLPCERALWYVLPQIRADLAKALVKQGMSQKEAADILGITPSAVSQYLHKKRAGKVKMPRDYPKRITDAAKALKTTQNEGQVLKLICKCCTSSRSTGFK